MRLGPGKVAEYLEERQTLSQKVTGLARGFCSLKCIRRSLLGREPSSKTMKTTNLHRFSGKRSVQTAPKHNLFPHALFPLEFPWNAYGAELPKYHWKPSRQAVPLFPTLPILGCFLSLWFHKAGREHPSCISSSPQDGPCPRAQFLGQIKPTKPCHEQPHRGWAVILLHATTALPPACLQSSVLKIFSLKETRTRSSGSLCDFCSRW